MNISEQSGRAAGNEGLSSRKNLPWLIGGGGCLLFLCLLALIGGGFLLGQGKLDDLTARLGKKTPTAILSTLATLSTPVPTEAPSPTAAALSIATFTPTPGPPAIHAVTFALAVTDDAEAIDPATAFKEGATKIHAILDYSNFSGDAVWERVWYLNGAEMLRSSAAWTGDESGSFDYYLEAGGQPLPSGEWTLEIYLDGNLLAVNSFTIQAPPTATPPPTATRTKTPTRTPTPAQAVAGGGGTYQLAFTKWDGNFHYVYIADTNGRNEKFIVSRAAGPSWSPDGKQLFFYGETGVDHQERPGQPGCGFGTISNGIVAIDLTRPPGDVCATQSGAWFCERKGEDSQSVPSDVCIANGIRVFQNLDWKEGSARWASVAPDGDSVAFDGRPGGPDYRIYFRSITDNQQYRFELIGEQADWSPNSQKLVFRSGRDNKQGIWISNRDNSGPARITAGGSDSFPAWSPNGRTIAFSREEAGNVDIYIVNTDGGNLRRLTTAPGPDTLPTFTPGGDIIFRSARSGSWGIWKMSGGGGNQRQIIAEAGVGPDWSYSKMDVR